MLRGNSLVLARLAAALLLGPFLSGAALNRGLGVLTSPVALLFPYLWLYLIVETMAQRRELGGGRVFLLGSAFSFLYEGLFTKRMQDGVSLSGLDWPAVLGGPLEWGMTAVVLFHVLDAWLPRERARDPGFPLWQAVVLAAVSVGAGLVLCWKTAFGHYRVEHLLGPMWLIDDMILAGAAVWLWREFQRSLDRESYRIPSWIWAVAGGGICLLGSSLLAQTCEGLGLPRALFYSTQVFWLGGLGVWLWTAWRDRSSFGEEPVRRSSPVLAAAAVRAGGTLLLLALFGSMSDARMAYWGGLVCDWPSKMLFYCAFLTSRLEV